MTLCIRTLLTIFTALACFAQGAEKEYRPEIIAADFTTKITNPFYPLTPGIFQDLQILPVSAERLWRLCVA